MPDIDSDSMLCAPVDEEERWLDALEKGELDDNGELKKEVDESLLTARQVRKGLKCFGGTDKYDLINSSCPNLLLK